MADNAFIVPGFLAGGISVGIKENGGKDLALIYSQVPATAAGAFTTNCFKAAPVLLDMERMAGGKAQAIIANSGNANAATGEEGLRDALAVSRALSGRLRIPDELVFVASTGIIGHRLPVGRITAGMGRLKKALRDDGLPDAQEAIMTTDLLPKMACRKVSIDGREVTLCGIAKGAGMIQPGMATMLAFFMTDACIDGRTLDSVFRRGIDRSFNAVTVDGCMSTNDTALILANGKAGNRSLTGRSRFMGPFREGLYSLLWELATAMVRDGEGATKVVEITVEGARSVAEARKAAYGVANSSLFKCACFGGDPNWGRIIAALGSVGLPLNPEAVQVFFEDVPVFAKGCGVPGHGDRLAEIMAKADIGVRIHLGMGGKGCRIAASDLSFEYVRINAHYHT